MTPRRRRFLGTSPHPVDPKGRMSISKRFQNALDRDDDGRPAGVLCADRDGGKCLWVFNDEGFEQEMSEFETRALRDGGDLDSQRDFFEYVTEFTLDTSGRLVIPARFRELAGIGDDAIATGVNSRLEIWSKDRYEARIRGKNSPLTPADAGESTSASDGGASHG